MKKLFMLMAVLVLSGCSTDCLKRKKPKTSVPVVKPDYDEAYDEYLQLGAKYLEMGRYDLAEPKLRRAIVINSKNPQAWNVLALLYEQERDIAAGYQSYEKLINSNPDYELGYANFATFLCTFEREPEREQLYQKMRVKDRNFQLLSYVSEGNCYRRRADLGRASQAYQQALKIDPHAVGALLPLADIELRENRPAEALKYLKIIHTYVGYSPDSVSIAIKAARQVGDRNTEDEMMRFMRANYMNTPQAQELVSSPGSPKIRETALGEESGAGDASAQQSVPTVQNSQPMRPTSASTGSNTKKVLLKSFNEQNQGSGNSAGSPSTSMSLDGNTSQGAGGK